MIRVNLLAQQTGPTVKRVWLPPEQRSAFIGATLLVVTGLGLGGFWWYQHSQAATVEAGIQSAESELTRLKAAATLVEQANARKAELEQRLALISRLRGAKRGPVLLLETVSRSLPEGLWLMEFRQQGLSVQIEGRALSLTSVTDFAQRLQSSGLFRHPVEILTTSTEVVEETPVIRFAVRAESLTDSATPDADAEGTSAPGASAALTGADAPRG